MDLHGPDAELARRADDAHRDLAAIGYEQSLIMAADLDLGDRLAGHDRLLVLDEELHDLAGRFGLHLVNVFITSIRPMTSPAATLSPSSL